MYFFVLSCQTSLIRGQDPSVKIRIVDGILLHVNQLLILRGHLWDIVFPTLESGSEW